MIRLYEGNENWRLQIEEGSDDRGKAYVFLHLDVYKWNKSVYKELQSKLKVWIEEFKEEGYDMLSFYLRKEQSHKFHESMRSLDFITPFGPNNEYKAGGWFIGD